MKGVFKLKGMFLGMLGLFLHIETIFVSVLLFFFFFLHAVIAFFTFML